MGMKIISSIVGGRWELKRIFAAIRSVFKARIKMNWRVSHCVDSVESGHHAFCKLSVLKDYIHLKCLGTLKSNSCF